LLMSTFSVWAVCLGSSINESSLLMVLKHLESFA
jgi:hypothetical protein